MDVQAETSKRIEKLEKDNAWLDNELRTANTKLDKCKKLLRMATEDINFVLKHSYYGWCDLCKHTYSGKCGQLHCKGQWKHADEVREVLEDE